MLPSRRLAVDGSHSSADICISSRPSIRTSLLQTQITALQPSTYSNLIALPCNASIQIYQRPQQTYIRTPSSLFPNQQSTAELQISDQSSRCPAFKMTSNNKAQIDTDVSSLNTTSSTSSKTQLLKSKFLPNRRTSNSNPRKEERSPGEKQAERKAGRMDMQTVATFAALK